MNNDDRRSRWRFVYSPKSRYGRVIEFLFEGTKAERDAYFLENYVCDLCKEEMKGGMQTMYQYRADSLEEPVKIEVWRDPYTDPMSSACAAEWDWWEDDE